MKVESYVKEVTPATPAVTEKRYVLDLSEHEARVLRALHGRMRCAPLEFLKAFRFLDELNKEFPGAYREPDYGGIARFDVSID
jgi:hypothetical protein